MDGDGLAKFYKDAAGQEESLKKSRQAVEETEGVILTYHGEPIRASYFRVSNGSTRDAGEEDCPYLSAVSCEQDQEAPDYRSVGGWVGRATQKSCGGFWVRTWTSRLFGRRGNFLSMGQDI